MSCCPKQPPSLTASDEPPVSNLAGDSNIALGESVECYAKNSPNPSGLHDDATAQVNDKIANTHIVVDCDLKVDTTFTLTKNSTRVATSWEMKIVEPIGITSIDGLSFSNNRLFGTCAESTLKKAFKVAITATDGAGIIDVRTFVFSPAKCKNSIQFVSPLPGAEINSKFGPRMHPIHKVMKSHNGIDMRYKNRAVGDVVAAADGEVTFAGNTGNGYGIAVKVKHLNNSGAHLCTTTYNHLAKVYVAAGQKVAANQKIGREGSTGASTGNHLHFEVRLPNNTPVDPEPYIRGEMISAPVTLPNGDADPSVAKEKKTSNANLTPPNVDAISNGCGNFGPNYTTEPPSDPNKPGEPPSTETPPTDSEDPFELAWYYTMKREVGSWWSTSPETSPTNEDIKAGKIETADQRKRVGFSNHKADKGGITKFGVAQKMNRQLDVKTLDYDGAKTLGYNSYWKANSLNKPKLVAIMCFDITYLCGAGGCRTILSMAGVSGSMSNNAAKAEQLLMCGKIRDAQIKYHTAKVAKEPSQHIFLDGWKNRANATYAYVASLP